MKAFTRCNLFPMWLSGDPDREFSTGMAWFGVRWILPKSSGTPSTVRGQDVAAIAGWGAGATAVVGGSRSVVCSPFGLCGR